jgi:deazaflavin-dependent oxidoreductase (nitroreductase family)
MRVTLATIGARSGAPRSTTLYAWEDEDRLVVVGSRGGSAHHPAWVHNLRAHPRSTVIAGRRTWDAVATEVPEGEERERLWQLVVDRFPLYATYQARTTRLIPLFVLRPTSG